jgi:ABC-2 type transport system ATP-binding protein
MHRGRIRALDTPAALVASLQEATANLDDVFREYTGDDLDGGRFKDVRATRRAV